MPGSNPLGSLMDIHTSESSVKKLLKWNAIPAVAITYCSYFLVRLGGVQQLPISKLTMEGSAVNLTSNDKADAPGRSRKERIAIKKQNHELWPFKRTTPTVS